MFLVGNLQLMLEILMIVEVADYESRAVAFHHAGEYSRAQPMSVRWLCGWKLSISLMI